jgi:anti-anti-sigma factor
VDRIARTISHRPQDAAVVTVPAGTCDLRDVPAIAELISEAVAAGASRLVIDLTALDAADTTLLSLLHRTHRRLADADGSLAVVATGTMADALERHGLNDVLMIHATLDQALGAMRRPLSTRYVRPATISYTSLPATLLVTLSGEWDVANAEQLASVLEEGINQALPLLVVDLSAVTFLDVRTIACLRRAAHRLAADGQRLALVAAPPAVERILDLLDNDLALPRHDSLVAARQVEHQALLTKRQLEILGLLDQGLSTKEIARTLWISPATVRNHVNAILAALRVHSRLQAVRRARELGLLPGGTVLRRQTESHQRDGDGDRTARDSC